jgi:hypothetical protein
MRGADTFAEGEIALKKLDDFVLDPSSRALAGPSSSRQSAM